MSATVIVLGARVAGKAETLYHVLLNSTAVPFFFFLYAVSEDTMLYL